MNPIPSRQHKSGNTLGDTDEETNDKLEGQATGCTDTTKRETSETPEANQSQQAHYLRISSRSCTQYYYGEGRLEANQQPATWKTPTEGLRTHRRISIEEAKQGGAKVILQTRKDLERMP